MARRGKKSRSKSKKGRQAASRDAAEEAPPPGAEGEGSAHDQLVDRLTAEAVATADTGAVQGDPAATEDAALQDDLSPDTRAAENEVFDLDEALEAGEESFDLDPASGVGAASGAVDAAEVHDLDAGLDGEEVFDLDEAAEPETEVHDLDAVPDDVEVFDLDAVAGIAADVSDLVTDEDIGTDAFDLDGVGTPTHDEVALIPDSSVDDTSPHDLDEGAALPSQGAEEAISSDRGVTSTPEARALLLAEALSHAEMQEARYRVPGGARATGRLKGATALSVFALAGLLAVAPPSLLVPDPPAQVDAADRRHGIVLTLLLQAEQIEAFRAREQQLPMTLEDVAARLPGVRYVRSSNRLFQLIAYTQRGDAVVYDSASPGVEFTEAQAGWHASEGS